MGATMVGGFEQVEAWLSSTDSDWLVDLWLEGTLPTREVDEVLSDAGLRSSDANYREFLRLLKAVV